MTRRVLVTAATIWEARQINYAEHFERRAQAKAYTADHAARTLKACGQMPEPQLNIRGELDTWNYNAARAKPIDEQIQLLRECGTPAELFVKWYWSDAEWSNFIEQFNSLPEPEPVYEIVIDSGHPEWKVVPYIMGTKGRVVPNGSTDEPVVPRHSARK